MDCCSIYVNIHVGKIFCCLVACPSGQATLCVNLIRSGNIRVSPVIKTQLPKVTGLRQFDPAVCFKWIVAYRTRMFLVQLAAEPLKQASIGADEWIHH